MATVAITHIWLDDAGKAWIDTTNTKVIEVALDKLAHGWSPEEIHFQHPHLSMAQIHAALAYYFDHQHEFDVEISRQEQEIAKMAAGQQCSPLRKRIEAARTSG